MAVCAVLGAIRPPTGRWLHLKNNDGVADADEVFDANGVPVGQANAAVTGGATNCFRIVSAMHANSRLVQSHPNDTHEIVWPLWEIEIIFRPNSVVEHSFILANPRPGRSAN